MRGMLPPADVPDPGPQGLRQETRQGSPGKTLTICYWGICQLKVFKGGAGNWTRLLFEDIIAIEY